MSTETLNPTNPEAAPRTHFVHGAIDNQSSRPEAPRPRRKERARKEIVESIDPENIHLYGKVVLSDVIEAREALQSDAFKKLKSDEKDEFIAAQLDELMVGDDPGDYPGSDPKKYNDYIKKNDVYMKNRFKLGAMLTAPEDKFDKIVKTKTVHQARLDDVKIARIKSEKEDVTPLKDRLKGLFSAEDGGDDSEKSPSQQSARKLRRELKGVDSEHNGLVGKIAETGTKPAYLAEQLERFDMHMFVKKYEINDKNRDSAQSEAIRKMIQPLVNAKNLEGPAKKAYEDSLVDSFHKYVLLSEDKRADFHSDLDTRYAIAKELSTLEGDKKVDAQESDPILSRTKRALGAVATSLVTRGKSRWNARNSEEAEQTDEEREEQLPKHRKKRSALVRSALSALGAMSPSDALARYRTNQVMREHDRAEMTDEERVEAREKKNTRKAAIAVGVVAVAAVGVGLYLQKYGFDNPFNGIGDGNRGPGDPSKDGPKPISPEQPVITEVDPGNGELLSRNELFDGSRGSRSLTPENAERLADFLDTYKVKENDDQGVWGISEKYLENQGVKNPTVFETDAVKDYILQHSTLTDSSIIYPGDTIKLK
jgi:hypothetical protein